MSEAEHDPAGVYRAMLAAAPAAPTEGARDATAQRDSEPRCDVCGAKTTDPWLDHRGCQQLASAQQDEREARPVIARRLQSAESALTRLIDDTNVGQPNRYVSVELLREMRATFRATQQVQDDAATHPDPLLAECVEALAELMRPYGVVENGLVAANGMYSAEYLASSQKARSVLAKVQAAKEGKS
jgi:hypothetical protein